MMIDSGGKFPQENLQMDQVVVHPRFCRGCLTPATSVRSFFGALCPRHKSGIHGESILGLLGQQQGSSATGSRRSPGADGRRDSSRTYPFRYLYTLLGSNISREKSILKMIFLFPRWDMLISWRVILFV